MEKDLIARRDKAQASFDSLVKQKDQKEAEIKEIDTELLRLQGEYRLVDDILSKKAKPSKVSPDAQTVDATATEA